MNVTYSSYYYIFTAWQIISFIMSSTTEIAYISTRYSPSSSNHNHLNEKEKGRYSQEADLEYIKC